MTALRPAGPEDLPALAALWHGAWHEAHAALVPAALLRERTPDSFARRLGPLLAGLRMAADADAPLGFCAVQTGGEGELDQLFLAPRARGTGLGAALLHDGERRLAAAGCLWPLLTVHTGNLRARAFYRREGWTEAGLRPVTLETALGPCTIETMALRKRLAADQQITP